MPPPRAGGGAGCARAARSCRGGAALVALAARLRPAAVGRWAASRLRRTNKRILALLKAPPPGYAGGRVRCWPRHWATLMFSMSGASCASTTSTCCPQILVREQRYRVRGESRRCGRALYRSAGQGDCSLCRRKALDPGLERAQGYLKLPNGGPDRQSHDYRRHGTTTVRALEVATGRIIAAHSKRRRRSSSSAS